MKAEKRRSGWIVAAVGFVAGAAAFALVSGPADQEEGAPAPPHHSRQARESSAEAAELREMQARARELKSHAERLEEDSAQALESGRRETERLLDEYDEAVTELERARSGEQ